MRERKLKEQFNIAAEQLRDAQLTAEQLARLQSIQYFFAVSSDQKVDLCAKRRTYLIRALILLFIASCLTLSPLSQLATILLECCGLQVMYCMLLHY